MCRKLEAKFSVKAINAKKLRRSRGLQQSDIGNDDEDEFSDAKRAVAAAQADVEVEDIDLGNNALEDDLAFDVDGANQEEDPEGLESDEDDELDEELGIEEDADSESFF